MKPSATNFSTSTTGLGRRLDTPSDEWFMARVTAASTSGGHNIYSLTEIEPDTTGFGYRDKDGGLTLTGVWELNDLSVAVGTRVMARFRAWNTTEGATYEIYSGSSSSTSSNNVFVSQFTATATDGTYMVGPVVPNGKRIKGTATANIQFTSYTRSFDVLACFMKCKNLGMTNNLPDSSMFPVEIWGTTSEMASVGPIASSFFKYDTTSTLVFDYSNNTGSDVTMQFGPQNASSSGTVTFLYGLRVYYSLE